MSPVFSPAGPPASLFILSLPRSLSSHVHALACAALGLHGPAWTSDGEILNMDRCALVMGDDHAARKYTLPRHARSFAQTLAFLSDVVRPLGHGYKDVVQPFAAAAWLAEHPEIRVLKIAPDPAHVADAMLRRNWLYPTVAAERGTDLRTRLMDGLLRAAATLERVPGETIAYEALMEGAPPLLAALGRLYPGRPMAPVGIAPEFGRAREEVLRRRDTDSYRDLARLAQELLGGGASAAADMKNPARRCCAG